MPVALSDIYPEFTNMLIQSYFFKIYDMFVPDDWASFAQVIPSTKEAEVYPTLGVVPKMGEFRGERKFSGLGSKETFMVHNKMYDAGISFPLTVFADDQYGIVAQRLGDLAMEGKRFPTELVYTVIHDGATTLGFDGKYLFDDHKAKGTATQSNTNATGTTLDVSALTAVIKKMRKFTDTQGRPLGIVPDTLIVPPDLEVTAKQILHSTFFFSVGTNTSQNATSGQGTSIGNLPTYNPIGGTDGILSKCIVNPYLTSTTEWYVACTTRMTKPVILQERQPVSLTVKMDPNTSDQVLKTNEGLASIIARWGAAPGDWHTIFQGST
jgi:phage major head subunit gpT-like protein